MTMPDVDVSAVDLARAAAQGDVRAFEQLVRPHVASVRRIAHSFCRNWTDADDLAQEALLKAFRSIATFDGSACAPWLFAVTRSVCLDWYRKHKRVKVVEFDESAPGAQQSEVFTQPTDPERALQAKSELACVWDAVRRLEPEFRLPLVLFEVEGMSYEDIARVEQVPVGTVRSRLARARAALQALLAEQSAPAAGTLSSRPSSSLRHTVTLRGPPQPERPLK